MQKIDFNAAWEFCDNKKSVTVNLPHDAMLFEERSRENPTGGASAYFSGNKYTYKKKFQRKDWQGKNLILQCEGVYQNSKVLINGKMAAQRPYGYVNFYAELTPYLCDGENEIEIIADNANTPNSRYYSGAGIYREVHLLVGGDSYIKPEGVKITTENNDTVCVKTDFVGEGTPHISIWDEERLIAEAEGTDVKLTVPNAKTWDEYSPNLYCCKVTLYKDGRIVDEVTERFGIRSISWNGNGFFVNGKETLLRGACVHHDNGILGACSFRDAEYRRVRILKEAGFNAVRSSHNPVSKAFLDACDELGIY
ncbi:MAG: beta-galactosidase, partial [Lachnospiraceae bacterium]|nr:beta-galactosidase [Lachnospiraceae bacterium]